LSKSKKGRTHNQLNKRSKDDDEEFFLLLFPQLLLAAGMFAADLLASQWECPEEAEESSSEMHGLPSTGHSQPWEWARPAAEAGKKLFFINIS
jgi:hypothetical protein